MSPATVAELGAHEGPVYVAAEDALYFTTVPRPQVGIKRLSLRSGRVTVVRADANKANGMALAPDGRLLVCEQGTFTTPARISLVDRATGATETLVDGWNGAPLSSPNDVAVKGDGSVWFTDPSYGFLQGFRPAPVLPDAVYRHDPGCGQTTVVANGFDKPNGLAFSPDERVLYVGDSGDSARHIEAFDIAGDGSLTGRRQFAVIDRGYPDGIKVDGAGRLYCAGPAGIHVFDPAGDLVGEIDLPGAVNLVFAAPDRMYVTADTAVWAARIPELVKEA